MLGTNGLVVVVVVVVVVVGVWSGQEGAMS